MRAHLQTRILFAAAVAVIAATVLLVSELQRSAADRGFAEVEAADALLASMLDQGSGLHRFVEGQPAGLPFYREGRVDFEIALVQARAGAEADEETELDVLERQERLGRHFEQLAEGVLADTLAGRGDLEDRLVTLDRTLLEFRRVNSVFRSELIDERGVNQRRAGLVAVALIIALSLVFAGFGYLLIDRRLRHEVRWTRRHGEFKDALQFARSEEEVYEVLRRHLEHAVEGAHAIVLNRNNSADALEARTPLPADSSLHETLLDATPESCLAIRSGRPYARVPSGEGLLVCVVCDTTGCQSTCLPSLVRGEVIGSVLVEHPRPLGEGETQRLAASVSEASPVIGHVRSLVLAEARAAMDALTGLPNSRTVQETLNRMTAQAARTFSPLAAVIFDLDHFKQVNDLYGHAKGDEVLAAVGDVIASTLRESDFAGRYGGEEFLAFLPNTNREGAILVAEKLREAIAGLRVPGLERQTTASFGIAVFPDDAGDASMLVRRADRALYAAKGGGRNRVEVFPRSAADEIPVAS